MSYRDDLKKRIRELEFEIQMRSEKKEFLELELQDLMRKEFEEEMREDNETRLLKG